MPLSSRTKGAAHECTVVEEIWVVERIAIVQNFVEKLLEEI